MKKKLKSLEEHDSITWSNHSSMPDYLLSSPNGIDWSNRSSMPISSPEPNGIGWSNHASMPISSPEPNGIGCPNCGEELMDSNPMITLTSQPAQKDTHCPSCDYTGYRII